MPTATIEGKSSKKGRGAGKGRRKKRLSARTADKYELYQDAVQSADIDIKFLSRTYKKIRGRQATSFREDFCGTALLCCEWVRQGPDHVAFGYDLDPEPIEWGRANNLAPLGRAAERITLTLADVRAPAEEKVDLRCAQNFSYCVFTEREQLLEYFRAARDSLNDEGLFVMDMHGGSEATEELEEERKIGRGATYIWEQELYHPVSGEYRCHIGFRFKDGSKLTRLFSYVWRFWHLTEVKDVLTEAGFERVVVYFEGTDEDGEGNGVFKKTAKGDNDASWIAYLVAVK